MMVTLMSVGGCIYDVMVRLLRQQQHHQLPQAADKQNMKGAYEALYSKRAASCRRMVWKVNYQLTGA